MSPRLPRLRCRKVVRALKRAGFVERRQRGSHLHMWRESDNKRVTVPIHSGRTMPIGTLRAILRDVDISVDEFLDLVG